MLQIKRLDDNILQARSSRCVELDNETWSEGASTSMSLCFKKGPEMSLVLRVQKKQNMLDLSKFNLAELSVVVKKNREKAALATHTHKMDLCEKEKYFLLSEVRLNQGCNHCKISHRTAALGWGGGNGWT